jgi:uncharacterized RDD family membrane protein YckC
MYQIIDQSGQKFGPASLDILRQWANERRLTPDMIVIDEATGQQGLAGDMLVGMGVFIDPVPPSSDDPVVTNTPPAGYAVQGGNEPGGLPTLQNRAAAFFVDLVLGTSFYLTLRFGLTFLLLPKVDTTQMSILLYVDYLFIPATGLYFLFRDAIYTDQSVGKRLSRIKVATTNGKKITPMHSALRNISAAPMIFLPIPFVGYLALAMLVLGGLAEAFMVLTQGKRIGDGIAMTKVVNE